MQVTTANGNPLTGGQDQQVAAAIRAQPGTAHFVAEAMPTVAVSGLTREINADAFAGAAAWTGYDMVRGYWYRGPGQVDVNTTFLAQTGLSVGDTTSVSLGGHVTTVRIVGEVFDPARQPLLITSWPTLGGAAAGLTVDQYDVGLRPGVSPDADTTSLSQALGPRFGVGTTGGGQFFAIATSLIGTLTLMIVVVGRPRVDRVTATS